MNSSQEVILQMTSWWLVNNKPIEETSTVTTTNRSRQMDASGYGPDLPNLSPFPHSSQKLWRRQMASHSCATLPHNWHKSTAAAWAWDTDQGRSQRHKPEANCTSALMSLEHGIDSYVRLSFSLEVLNSLELYVNLMNCEHLKTISEDKSCKNKGQFSLWLTALYFV